MLRLLLLTALLVAPAATAQTCPTSGFARPTAWYRNNAPVSYSGRSYVKYGLPRVLSPTDVARVAAVEGVGVFAEAGTQGPYEILYIVVDAGCEFQPYQRSAEPAPAPAPSPAPAPEPKPAAPSATPVSLKLGQTISGTLTNGDARLSDDSPYDVYTFAGTAGQQVRITLRSEDFDAYVHIGHFRTAIFDDLESDDDSAGGTDAQITVTLPASGLYAIRANCLEAGERGRYTLTVEPVR